MPDDTPTTMTLGDDAGGTTPGEAPPPKPTPRATRMAEAATPPPAPLPVPPPPTHQAGGKTSEGDPEPEATR